LSATQAQIGLAKEAMSRSGVGKTVFVLEHEIDGHEPGLMATTVLALNLLPFILASSRWGEEGRTAKRVDGSRFTDDRGFAESPAQVRITELGAAPGLWILAGTGDGGL